MKVIDLFAGCGGLSLGFAKAGFTVTKAVELDSVIAQTYQKNHPAVDMIVDDIRNLDAPGIFAPAEASVIIGGPPCQGFSMAGSRIRQGFIDDPRNYLFKHYFHIVKTVKPEVFVMENVKGMLTMQGGKIFAEIQRMFSDPELLDGCPYQLLPKVVKASEFGIPQKRERLILIGTTVKQADLPKLWEETRQEILREDPAWFDTVSVADAIGNLPQVSGDGVVPNPVPGTAYQAYLASGAGVIRNHTKSNHSAVAVERMKQVRNGENYTALKETVKSVHSGAYGRLCWDEQAATITTRFDTPAGGRFIHPEEDRTLSPREAARIQSFPDDFVFYGDKRSVSRQIGNAVPPKIAYFLARMTRKILEQKM